MPLRIPSSFIITRGVISRKNISFIRIHYMYVCIVHTIISCYLIKISIATIIGVQLHRRTRVCIVYACMRIIAMII